ncbi:hypothetical protein OSB04_016036 [Centaurea solstitialis]|uniref:CCHC-type domain-containing protein n=1 Tax=Centaurea solstitialis TaxID=347529 RepID=A0AA38WKN9_9ASTR|nr:hypothetical protein OSB04_016036 [Centaurea solstitialis]
MAITVTSTNNLSLRSILEKDKLTGSNFLDWERNLMIVLRHERKWYVLEEPLGEAPPANAPAAARNAHKKHSDDLLDVACLMLATMSPDLQAGLINTNAYDMIRQLRDMFQTQARTERYDATKAFNECKMVKGTSVSDHVMKMKRHLDHLERLGHPVPLQLATDTILNSLSEDYSPFVVNYNMNNMEKTIAELHSMLKTAELNMGNKNKTKDVLMVKDGGVKKKNGQASTSKGKGPVQAIQSAPKKGKSKGKGKKVKPNKARTDNRCFICNEIGHWRQNCPKRHEEVRNEVKCPEVAEDQKYKFFDISQDFLRLWIPVDFPVLQMESDFRLQGSSGDCQDKVFGVQNSNRHSIFAAMLCETLILMPSGGVKEMMGIAMHHFLVEESLSYVESPIAVLRLRNKKSSTEKVQGQLRKESEWIREQEAEMLEKYRDFSQIDFGDEILPWEIGSFSLVNRRIVMKFGQRLHDSLFFNMTGGIEHRRLQ